MTNLSLREKWTDDSGRLMDPDHLSYGTIRIILAEAIPTDKTRHVLWQYTLV
ncbi:uncharacterized protein PHALS_02038 [Plasmopara halstedii]|uniref:Uncharacterized protein n=1 Tax=Plasmopara halstedii TaxID=4781 RepID=A0A0N7L709_PLAHL|nr:uncharacterized protein PHALS_02038 [Plasmopara halstedii]CEG45763.1 hypothetical protein PHALS_02038 [Plasmopara halstedii]|eukprot:XP_024582132.1 hypothetical protein PHALS_02038 [Plasmopara halstedii]